MTTDLKIMIAGAFVAVARQKMDALRGKGNATDWANRLINIEKEIYKVTEGMIDQPLIEATDIGRESEDPLAGELL